MGPFWGATCIPGAPLTFWLGRLKTHMVLKLGRALPRKLKVGFSFALGSQPFLRRFHLGKGAINKTEIKN